MAYSKTCGAAVFAAFLLIASCGSPEAKTETANDAAAMQTQSAAAASGAQTSPGAAAQTAAQTQPVFGFESILKTPIYDDGTIALTEYDLIFAPQGEVDASAVIKSGNDTAATFGFFPTYKFGQGVFGRLRAENHSTATLTPGNYKLDLYVSGALATSVPFNVVAGASSDDPFNPQSTVKFVGPWQEFAYFIFTPFQDSEAVNVNFWAGASDLAPGVTRAPVQIKLSRNGKLVAHSKQTQGMLDHELLRKHTLTLYQPHDRNGAANATLFSKNDIQQNGDYTLTVELTETGETIREYAFQSKGGELVPHARTALGYQPREDYIAPRVLKPGTTSYEFVEAYWIEAP
ncbi:hypothetical protein [Hyphococcus sp.]|uniref:hypothetical protein n=1 Tax=Hyphococcus sp. TaxID=2038636 RepID=UPI003CCBBCB0